MYNFVRLNDNYSSGNVMQSSLHQQTSIVYTPWRGVYIRFDSFPRSEAQATINDVRKTKRPEWL